MMDDGKEQKVSARFFAFEKLDIYHEAGAIATEVYGLTSTFPADERSDFLMQARGSAYEVVAALQSAVGLHYLEADQLLSVKKKAGA